MVIGFYFGFRKKTVVAQLKICYSEKTDQEIKTLTKQIYKELAITCAEVFVFPDKYFDNRVEIVGMDLVDEVLAQGKGVIVVSAHFSNWELGAKLLARKYGKIFGIIKKIKNPYFDDYINKSRVNAGIQTINMKHALKHIIHAIRNNQVIAVLVDQYAKRQGVEMKFLGHDTMVYTSIAQMTLKYKVPVLMAFDVRDEYLQHKIYYFNPNINNELELTQENIFEITKKINGQIESFINNYPQLWFWVHRKFRKDLKRKT